MAASGSATLASSNGTLDAVTVGTNLTINNSSYTYVKNGLALGSGVTLDIGGAYLYFTGSQSISTAGTATLQSSGGALYFNNSGLKETLTLGPGVTWRGSGMIYDSYYSSGATYKGALINQGTIEPGGAGAIGSLNIYSDFDTSSGTLKLEQSNTSAYDRIYAYGTVTLGAGTVLTTAPVSAATYVAGDAFDVLQSSTAISGTAPAVSGFTTAITPAPAPVYLRLTAQAPAPTPPPGRARR